MRLCTDGADCTDSFIRANAITLSGTPIADLDTAKIFAYASHFTEIPPTALG